MGRKKTAAGLYKDSVHYDDYVLNGIIPFMKKEMNRLCPIMEKYRDNREITKSDWEYLKSCTEQLADISAVDETFMNPFNKEKLKDVKYKEKHSSYYEVVTDGFSKYFMNKSALLKIEANAEYEDYLLFSMSKHLFMFVTAPEKI